MENPIKMDGLGWFRGTPISENLHTIAIILEIIGMTYDLMGD